MARVHIKELLGFAFRFFGRILMLIKRFAIIGRRDSFDFFENAAEIERVFVTDNVGNLIDVVARTSQKIDCVVDSDRDYILHGRFCGQLFEIPGEPAERHASGFCVSDAYENAKIQAQNGKI